MFSRKSEYECIGINEAIHQKTQLVQYAVEDIELNIVCAMNHTGINITFI